MDWPAGLRLRISYFTCCLVWFTCFLCHANDCRDHKPEIISLFTTFFCLFVWICILTGRILCIALTGWFGSRAWSLESRENCKLTGGFPSGNSCCSQNSSCKSSQDPSSSQIPWDLAPYPATIFFHSFYLLYLYQSQRSARHFTKVSSLIKSLAKRLFPVKNGTIIFQKYSRSIYKKGMQLCFAFFCHNKIHKTLQEALQHFSKSLQHFWLEQLLIKEETGEFLLWRAFCSCSVFNLSVISRESKPPGDIHSKIAAIAAGGTRFRCGSVWSGLSGIADNDNVIYPPPSETAQAQSRHTLLSVYGAR